MEVTAQNKERVYKKLEEQIFEKEVNSTLFKWCQQFYLLYPQIGATVSNQFKLPYFKKGAVKKRSYEKKVL